MIRTQPASNAVQLLKELQSDRSIPKYNAELLAQIEREMRDLEAGLSKSLLHQQEQQEKGLSQEQDENSISSGIVIQHQSFLRNKRCVMAYYYERMKRMRKLRWGSGAVQNIPRFIQENMSENEIEYMHKYDELLREYMDGIGFDLFADVTPPKDIFVEVKVIKDDEAISEGIVTLESGVIKLEKNQRLFLRRIDADMLIQKGLVEHVVRQIN
jgi:GINS complex subunit 1